MDLGLSPDELAPQVRGCSRELSLQHLTRDAAE
jgi:hypothetical protein